MALFELAELYSPSLMFPGRPQAMTAILVCLGIKKISSCVFDVLGSPIVALDN